MYVQKQKSKPYLTFCAAKVLNNLLQYIIETVIQYLCHEK